MFRVSKGARPVTPEDTLGIFPSPDGRYLAAEHGVRRISSITFEYNIRSGESRENWTAFSDMALAD
jgi:hypothetical protein